MSNICILGQIYIYILLLLFIDPENYIIQAEEKPKKKRKKLTVAEKTAKAREEEERIRALEKRAIESESAPRSTDQFERALLSEPNCSELWIAYMAFYLQVSIFFIYFLFLEISYCMH